MIGIIIITHGNLAKEFILALEHIIGPQKNIKPFSINPDDDIEESRKRLINDVKAIDEGQGVAIFTDMFGGTPSNLAISLLKESKIEVVAGINLPMLIKFAKIRETAKLKDAILQAQESGRTYINVASELLANKERKRQ
jgi:PTS system mannose-specific IIA component